MFVCLACVYQPYLAFIGFMLAQVLSKVHYLSECQASRLATEVVPFVPFTTVIGIPAE